jgi:hypothetical protein
VRDDRAMPRWEARNDACLHGGLGQDRLDRLGKAGEAVDAADQDVLTPRCLSSDKTSIQNLAPSVS